VDARGERGDLGYRKDLLDISMDEYLSLELAHCQLEPVNTALALEMMMSCLLTCISSPTKLGQTNPGQSTTLTSFFQPQNMVWKCLVCTKFISSSWTI